MQTRDRWKRLRALEKDLECQPEVLWDAVRVVVYSVDADVDGAAGGSGSDRVVAKGAAPSELARAVAQLTSVT